MGAALVKDPRVDGVAFTGGTDTGIAINRALAARDGPIAKLIAETGGLNAMIVDSSALPEQVVDDVLASAFDSAGQRCSALRVLFVQEDVAEATLDMLIGAVRELEDRRSARLCHRCRAGDRRGGARRARGAQGAHAQGGAASCSTCRLAPMRARARHLCRAGDLRDPVDLGVLKREVFGPILHVVRFAGDRLGEVCDAINATGYGLTLGLHSRIEATADFVAERVKVGNMYVNRNQIGAVVGVQPFGGEGLSGTGPKAGGPHYLDRFRRRAGALDRSPPPRAAMRACSPPAARR